MILCNWCQKSHVTPGECWKPSLVIGNLTYKDWTFDVAPDESWLRVVFTELDSDHPVTPRIVFHKGRKWNLSVHMTRSEIVQTALKAVLAAEEHEARERFKYKGRAIFGPHFHIDALLKLAEQGQFDIREAE